MRYQEDIEIRMTARHKVCMRRSGNLKNKTVLDVGCGIGWYEKYLIENKCKYVVGVDLNLNMLRKARDALKQFSRCDFVVAAALYLPFKQESFHMVSMFDVIEHLPSGTERQALIECYKILKEKGILFISTPNDTIITKLLDPAYFLIGHRHYKASSLSKLLKDSGFFIKSIYYGGGVIELLSMILLYIFKSLNMEIPLKRIFEYLREKEYNNMTNSFVTIFVNSNKE